MKLYYSPTSPYVRKVIACAIVRGLESRIEKHTTNPHASPPDLVADNPLSKVPCLVTDDGMSLFGSQLICEYLDSLGDAPPLFPSHGATRWRALKFQSLGDGILDVAVPCRGEQGRPAEAARDAQIARFKAAISRAVERWSRTRRISISTSGRSRLPARWATWTSVSVPTRGGRGIPRWRLGTPSSRGTRRCGRPRRSGLPFIV